MTLPLTRPPLARRKPLRAVVRVGMLVGSFLLAWFFFHLLGRNLAALPNELQLDTLWHDAAQLSGDDD